MFFQHICMEESSFLCFVRFRRNIYIQNQLKSKWQKIKQNQLKSKWQKIKRNYILYCTKDFVL